MKNLLSLCRKMNKTCSFSENWEARVARAKHFIPSICKVFWGPDLEFCSKLMDADYWQEVKETAKFLDVDQELIETIEKFLCSYDHPAKLHEELEAEYVRLFVNSIHGIVAPLYQSCYGTEQSRLMGPETLEMKRRLEAAGLAQDPEVSVPPDHLCIELEYLYFHLSAESAPTLTQVHSEAIDFCTHLLKPWVEILAKKLRQDPVDSFYCFWGELLCKLLTDLQLVATVWCN